MSSDKVMVHAATGASPPRLPVSKQDVGCSPINIRSSTQSTAELGKGFDPSSILLNQDEQNIMMKKVVDNEHTSLSLSSSWSNGNNSTPILSSLSSNRPSSLMSLELNNRHGAHTPQRSSSTTNAHRWWPVNRKYSYRQVNKYRSGGRYVRGGGGGDVKKNGDDSCQRYTRIRSGDCHHNQHCGTTSCSQCCNLHHHHH